MDLNIATGQSLVIVNSLSLMITLSYKPRFVVNNITFHVCLLEDPLASYGFIPSVGSTKVHTLFSYMESIFDFMSISHLSYSELFKYSSQVVGSSSFMSNMSFCSLMRKPYLSRTVYIILDLQSACALEGPTTI